MTYLVIHPPASLQNHVRHYWVLESDACHYMHRSMADVCPELLFHYKGRFDELKPGGKREKSYTSGIHGPTEKVSWFGIERSFGIFGIYLYPYALQDLFNIPSCEFANQQIDLFDLLGNEGKILEEQMFACVDNNARLKAINSFLEGKLNKNPKKFDFFNASVHRIKQAKGSLKINALSNEFCLSERQFERNFKSATGLRPKLFSKIVRFHAAFADCNKNSTKSLTEIALDNGYYDQSHFIQDFKTFSGLNPKKLYSGQATGLDWLEN